MAWNLDGRLRGRRARIAPYPWMPGGDRGVGTVAEPRAPDVGAVRRRRHRRPSTKSTRRWWGEAPRPPGGGGARRRGHRRAWTKSTRRWWVEDGCVGRGIGHLDCVGTTATSRPTGETPMALGYDGKLYILAFDHRGSFQKKM